MVPLRIIHRSASACFNRSSKSLSKSSSMHEKINEKDLTDSSPNAFNDSCNSLCWDDEGDLKPKSKTNDNDKIGAQSERPLRKLCRTVSRRFASFHSSKSTVSTVEMLDSATSLSLEDDDDDDDDDDACSFEGDGDEETNDKIKRVRFSTRVPEVHLVENSHYMAPQQRDDCWYSRREMNKLKYESRVSRVILQKEEYTHLQEFLLDVFTRSQLLADSGLEDDEVPHYHNEGGAAQPSSMSQLMAGWCDSEVVGESCRGLEKRIIGQASLHRAAREFVLQNNFCRGDDDGAMLAEEYQALSQAAVIFAQCTAKADAMVAGEHWWR
eukprot:scaffold8690_cov190-Amphora_coffeaeformis.AAC.8